MPSGDFEMREIEFKTVSPLFEMERDGIKPFTTRLLEIDDTRFKELYEWRQFYPQGKSPKLYIRITNPSTGESFTRLITNISYVEYTSSLWLNIHWSK
jgi:hypothetical protein